MDSKLSIFDVPLLLTRVGIRHPDTLIEMELYKNDSLEAQPSGFGVSEEYCLYAKSGAIFRCNDAEMDAAVSNAKMVVVQELYGAFRSELHKIMQATYGNDKQEIMRLVGGLLDKTSGKES
jgi:hypothetical protein